MFRSSENVSVLSVLWACQGGKEALERDSKGHCCLGQGQGRYLELLVCAQSCFPATSVLQKQWYWSLEVGTGSSAVEGMCILEGCWRLPCP